MGVVLYAVLTLLAIGAAALVVAKLPCLGFIVVVAIVIHLVRRAGL